MQPLSEPESQPAPIVIPVEVTESTSLPEVQVPEIKSRTLLERFPGLRGVKASPLND